MRFRVLTLFPEMVTGPLSQSIIGRAQSKGTLEVSVHQLREFGIGRHRTVDDTPYGGGSGMVMRCDVVAEAVRTHVGPEVPIVLFDPAGSRFDQRMAERFASLPELALICGHYEGIDARFAAAFGERVLPVSIGPYVLTGGEYAALVVIDAVSRLVPGVLGNPLSAMEESFSDGDLPEHPQYTRPRTWEGFDVPEVLLSGDHARVRAWRAEAAKRRG